MIVAIIILVETLVGIIFCSLFAAASDADKAQEPVYDEDSKKHSGLLEEE